MSRQRELRITFKPVRLVLCIALGLWLGALAVAASAWLALQLWPEQVEPVARALAPAPAMPPVDPSPERQAGDAQQQMFERYQHILQEQQARQAAEAAEGSPRNLNNPRCQFWLQQNRTAPTDKSQAQVLEFCY